MIHRRLVVHSSLVKCQSNRCRVILVGSADFSAFEFGKNSRCAIIAHPVLFLVGQMSNPLFTFRRIHGAVDSMVFDTIQYLLVLNRNAAIFCAEAIPNMCFV